MFEKLIIAVVIAFIITLVLARLLVGLLQKGLSVQKYRLTKRVSDIITCLIVVTLGIGLGKELLYILL